MIRLLGWRVVAFGTPIVAWFCLFGHAQARRSLDAYWRHLRPHWAADRRQAAGWAHLTSFLRILADRVLAYADPAAMDFSLEGPDGDRLRAAMARPEGCILLSAHVGNWELAGRLLGQLTSRRVHVVMVEADSAAVKQALGAVMGEPPGIIDPRRGFEAALAIGRALADGEVVCMLGDRWLPGQPSCVANLLGRPAQLPAGPFLAAASTGAIILPCFLIRRKRCSYRLLVGSPWRAEPGCGRQAAARSGVRWWAGILTAVVRRRPRQWHNFFDVWARR
jgi:predicted LPLAT superfamily acyltransferase